MLQDVLGVLAQAKEWGLILLLVFVMFLYGKSVLGTITQSLHERDRINGEREERLIRVLIGFSESIPKLTNAIDDLRNWLGERFDDLNEDLDYIKHDQAVLSAKVVNHEGRIGRLEKRSSEPQAGATAEGRDPDLADRIGRLEREEAEEDTVVSDTELDPDKK